MVGAICKRDILAHPFVTIHCFGWPVFFRALVAGRNRTFLSLLTEPRLVLPAVTEVSALVGKCVELELRAKRIYQALARRFDQQEPVRRLFESLARQENGHAELEKLKAFQRATSNHISFICREIPKLAPDLASTCRQMLDQHAKEEDQ